jgi:hypothetical protein
VQLHPTKRVALLVVLAGSFAAVAWRVAPRTTGGPHHAASEPAPVIAVPLTTSALGSAVLEARPSMTARAELRGAAPPGSAPRPVRTSVHYDDRTFDGMASDWAREPDNDDLTVNTRTFIAALIDTTGDDAHAGAWPESLSVRCHTSVCRLDFGRQDVATLAQVRAGSPGAHLQMQAHNDDADGGTSFEAYLGKDPEAPAESP